MTAASTYAKFNRMLTLEVTRRDAEKSAEDVRNEGKVPAIFYGPKEDTTSVEVDAIKFEKIYEEAGESTIISLKDEKGEHDALIQEVQKDPVTDKLLHADFYIIEKGKKISVSVPFIWNGVAPAEKNLGGVVVKVAHEIEIEALPRDLPHELEVDLTLLENMESKITAKDLKLPEGVELVDSPDEVIAAVTEAKEEEELPVESPDLDSIEVEAKGKEEEGGEGEAAPSEESGSEE